MGTNYYHRTNICPHCDRYDENHIGKSSGGWTFGFHGEREKEPEFNSLGGVVVSFEDWKTRFKDGKIFDEYGDEISVEKFINLVETKRDAKLNHTEYCVEQHSRTSENWLDDEENSFTEGEFS